MPSATAQAMASSAQSPHLVRVGKAVQITGDSGLAGVAVQHEGQILAGDILQGLEGGGAGAVDDLVLIGPQNRAVEPLAGGHVLKDHLAGDGGLVLDVVENLGQLGADEGGVGLHGGGAGALQKAILHGVVDEIVGTTACHPGR